MTRAFAALAATVLVALGIAPAAGARAPAQTNWQVVRASGKITWELDSVPFDYLGFASAKGNVIENWHYLGHGPQVSFPFTTLRRLGPLNTSMYSFQIRPIAGSMSGSGNGTLTDGTTGGCQSQLSSLPNFPSRTAMLWMAKDGSRNLALWVTADDPTQLFDVDPCATQIGSTVGQFPTAQPDQRSAPTVAPTHVSELRIDPVKHRNKRQVLHLRAKFNLIVNAQDGQPHKVGTEVSTATLIIKLKG